MLGVIWHLEYHALRVVVHYPEGIPGDVHPVGDWLLIVLQVKFLLPSQHLNVNLIDVIDRFRAARVMQLLEQVLVPGVVLVEIEVLLPNEDDLFLWLISKLELFLARRGRLIYNK